MKKWYSLGLLLLVLVLAASLLVACKAKEETTTTAAPTETTAAPTETTAAPTETTAAAEETGIFFTDQGNSVVLIEVVPGPNMRFPVSTEGGFADKVEAFDASGASLGELELPDAAAGLLDYSSIEGIAKIVVTDVPHGNVEYEYLIP